LPRDRDHYRTFYLDFVRSEIGAQRRIGLRHRKMALALSFLWRRRLRLRHKKDKAELIEHLAREIR